MTKALACASIGLFSSRALLESLGRCCGCDGRDHTCRFWALRVVVLDDMHLPAGARAYAHTGGTSFGHYFALLLSPQLSRSMLPCLVIAPYYVLRAFV